jgi:hypothetical protein|tara:strand:- start:695 stop:1228 length:534 start_codon:yes stop_codon:yes gene_type:complete
MENQQNATAESRMSDPRISQFLMTTTFVVGAIGYFFGFLKISSGSPEEAVGSVALLSVGVVGILSMVRHSVFHRSDAIRIGWDQGRRNNFQIEVGFANLAIGLPAIIAVAFDWGVVVEAAFVIAYALYFVQVTVLVLMDRDDGKLNLFRVVMSLMQTGLLGYFALSALASAFSQQVN